MTRARRGVQLRVRRRTAVAGLAVACLLGVAAPAGAVASGPQTGTGLGVRLMDAPTDRRDDSRAYTYVVDQVRPGAAFTRRVEVHNDSDTPARFLVYPAPATIEGGSFVVGARGESGTVPTWVTTSPSVLDLPARGTAQVAVVVRVPVGAPAGEQLGAVVVEQPPTGTGSLGVAVRAAVRVYLSVGEGAEPASDLAVTDLVPRRTDDGLPQVTATVRNTGARALDVQAALSLSRGPGGLSAGPFPARSALTLAPGQSGTVVVDLARDLAAGPWDARLDATSGRLSRSVASTGLVFPTDPGTAGAGVRVVTVSGSESEIARGAGPFAVVLAAVLAVLVGMVLLGLARRRRDDEELVEELAGLLESDRQAGPTPLG